MAVNKTRQKLSKEATEQIRAGLVKRKEQILKDLEEIKGGDNAHQVKYPEYGDKLDENAQEVGEYSTNLAANKVLEDTLRDIDSALERMEKDTYGICKYCGEPIPEKRMLARPVASACVECKTKLQNQ